LDENYFENEIEDVQTKSDDALRLVAILKNNPPRHRF